MNQHSSTVLESEVDREQIVLLKTGLRGDVGGLHGDVPGGSLVERLDPALGEATSGMGALLTELIRRTLRGGVQRIDDELQTQVEEKVDASVADRMPQIETAAGQVAESAARQVAGQECQAIEQEVKQTANRLDERLSQTQQELASTEDKLTETKRQLAAAERRLAETQQTLGQQIVTESHRVEKNARELIREQVENLTQRSKNTLQSLNGRIGTLDGRSEALEFRLCELEAQLSRAAGRIAELEKPRGLRRLWKALTNRRRKLAKK